MVSLPEVRRESLELHGDDVSCLIAGSGPALVLIHGVTGTARQWENVMAPLAECYTVIAPDLLGHGQSAKPRGDYSLGAYASGIRDLLVGLGHDKASIAGHSLGGGIAMQFAYQFPERCARLALISSGGLGTEVSMLLRAAALPGAEIVLPLISNRRVHGAGNAVAGLFSRVGLRPGADLTEVARGYGSLADSDTRRAFLHTLRSVVDAMGQRVTAIDRLYLAADIPTLIVWGARDRVIPMAHGEAAAKGMPSSRLEIFERSGHFPQVDEPVRFAEVMADFLATTDPAELNTQTMRDKVRRRAA